MKIIKSPFILIIFISLILSLLYWYIPSLVRLVPQIEPISEIFGMIIFIPALPTSLILYIFLGEIAMKSDLIDFSIVFSSYVINLLILFALFNLLKNYFRSRK